MKIRLLLVLFLSLLFVNYAQAAQEKDVIRVGISNQSFSSYDYQQIKLSSTNMIKIVDMSQNIQLDPIEANKIITVEYNDNLYNIYVDSELKYKNLEGPIIFSSNSELEIVELNRKGKPAKYQGMIELCQSKKMGYFNVVNVIDIDNYLRGVVPNEMPASFGLEAIKAQSIAAKNYATNAKISSNYDVVDSTASQVYYGVNSYKDISDLAIMQTKGIYALYNEEPISALYFSTSAGITDDWDDVFGNGIPTNKYPYLKARYDKNNKPLKSEDDVKEFFSKKDNGYDVNSPKFRWEYEFEREELEEVIEKGLLSQSIAGHVYPKYDGSIKFEGLKEIKALDRTQSGKIRKIEIISTSGNYEVETQLAIRRIFKKNNTMLPSGSFYVEPSKDTEKISDEENDDDGIKIFSFSSRDERLPKSFKFIGGGYGHGVGMSQYGAYALAKEGKYYPEILNHYYSYIKLSTMPKTVLFNNYNTHYKQEFYFEPKLYEDVYLLIDNTKNISEFPFIINEYEFMDTTSISNKKILKINITKYLHEGLNTIDFLPLTSENRGKYIIYRVEFQ